MRKRRGGTAKITFDTEVTIHGVLVPIDVVMTVSYEHVDNGIGSYEYWGAKGVHHQWDIEWDFVEFAIDGYQLRPVLKGSQKLAQMEKDWAFWTDIFTTQLEDFIQQRVEETVASFAQDEADHYCEER